MNNYELARMLLQSQEEVGMIESLILDILRTKHLKLNEEILMKTTSELSRVELHRLQMLRSYTDAIMKVGGAPEVFLEKMDSMTVAEMMDVLAQNGVRFTTNR